MQGWQAWQAYVRVVINDPTYSDASAQSSFEAMNPGTQYDAWNAVAAAAGSGTNNFGIEDQAVLNLHIQTESGSGTADLTFSVEDDAITNIYIDNLVVDESKSSPLA